MGSHLNVLLDLRFKDFDNIFKIAIDMSWLGNKVNANNINKL